MYFKLKVNPREISNLSLSLGTALAPLSPLLLEPSESLSPLLPLSLPGPWCLPKFLRTRVGELSLDVVSGALLSMLAMPVNQTENSVWDTIQGITTIKTRYIKHLLNNILEV